MYPLLKGSLPLVNLNLILNLWETSLKAGQERKPWSFLPGSFFPGSFCPRLFLFFEVWENFCVVFSICLSKFKKELSLSQNIVQDFGLNLSKKVESASLKDPDDLSFMTSSTQNRVRQQRIIRQ